MTAGVIEIGSGRLRGVERRGIWSFAGIPYAAPPTGLRRWRPPIAAEPWAGIRACDEFGPIAPQAPGLVELSLAGEPTDQSEDCLSLNVWTPGLDGERRPVMVWIHGGSFLSGSGSGILYRGGLLAREGGIVVVTVNYRLGLLGFLSHPVLADDGQPWLDGRPWSGTGNWGLADQVAALCWVRDNIAAFGGNPGNVTLFGESAGGMSVSALLATPAARGLFRRAIVQSGPAYTHPVDRASTQAEKLAAHMGVVCTRAELERLPVEQLVSGLADFVTSRANDDDTGLPMRPVVGPGLLPEAPEDAVAAGSASEVPLIIGTTRDESAFFVVGDERLRSLDGPGLRRWLRRLSPDPEVVDELVAVVTAARASRGEPTSPRDLWVAIASEFIFRVPSVSFAGRHAHAAAPGVATYNYLFTQESPAFRGVLGACHALDLPFVFGTLHNPAVQAFSGGDDKAFALSSFMRASWTAFARWGSPRLPDWFLEGGVSDADGAGSGGPSTALRGNGVHRHGATRVGTEFDHWRPWEPTNRPTTVLGPWESDGLIARLVNNPRHEEIDATAAALGIGEPTLH